MTGKGGFFAFPLVNRMLFYGAKDFFYTPEIDFDGMSIELSDGCNFILVALSKVQDSPKGKKS